MSGHKQFRLKALAAVLLLAAIGVRPVSAQDSQRDGDFADIARLAPKQQASDTRLSFDAWGNVLEQIVFRMGRSARDVPPPIYATLGTRFTYGHESLYRLEGNRVTFFFLDETAVASLVEYRKELESLPDRVDITTLHRNEQLAYWVNLHNVAVISRIAEAYPVKWPSRMKLDGQTVALDELPFITVRGVKLSPKDIRTQIVFPHWQNPKVIYGFYRGEIGGPSINDEAFKGENVSRLLDENAREFVNSLRGVEKRGKTLHVSTLYEEAAPFFFRDWTSDVRAHIASYARKAVSDALGRTEYVEASLYEKDIADLAGGEREPVYFGNQGAARVPGNVARLVLERRKKIETLIKRREFQPRVTVIDMNDPDSASYEVE